MSKDVFVHYKTEEERMTALRQMVNARHVWEANIRERAEMMKY